VVGAQLRQRAVTPRVPRNEVTLLVPRVDEATAEALGYIRSINPDAARAVFLSTEPPPEHLVAQWRRLCGWLPLEALPRAGDVREAVRLHVEGIPRGPGDFATVVLPETIEKPGLGYLVRRRDLVRLKGALLRERRIVVTDVPVVTENGAHEPSSFLVPQRTVALVFVSGVHDAAIRAVNYARSLDAAETRAVFFALDHEGTDKIIEQWFDRNPRIALDVVDAPYRDLTAPMLDEVRRYTAREDTVVSLIIPELIPRRGPHYLLHRQTALFVKRLFLFEPRVILSAVPYHLE
jgi:hypothetical protein